MSFFVNWKLSINVAQIDLGIFSGTYYSNPASKLGLNGCIFTNFASLKMGSQFFGRCRFLRIGNFHLVLPKSIWALFRVATVVTQLRNWAKMAVSLPILPTLKMGTQFFGRCRFLRIGNFHLVLPKSIWAFFRVSTVVTQLQIGLKWLYLYRFCQFWSWEANFLVDVVFWALETYIYCCPNL